MPKKKKATSPYHGYRPRTYGPFKRKKWSDRAAPALFGIPGDIHESKRSKKAQPVEDDEPAELEVDDDAS